MKSQLKRLLKDKKAVLGIGIGLKRYINSSRYKGTQNPIKLLENIREVYKEVII